MLTDTTEYSQIIDEPQDNDVILGRGSSARRFCGTKRYNELLREKALEHKMAIAWEDKEKVAVDIISTIHATGGRFLRQLPPAEAKKLGYSGNKKVWVKMETDDLLRKTKQALRDTCRKNFQSTSSKTATKPPNPAPIFQSPGYFPPGVPLGHHSFLQNLWCLVTKQSPLAFPSAFPSAHMVSPAVSEFKEEMNPGPSLLAHYQQNRPKDKQKRQREHLEDLTRPPETEHCLRNSIMSRDEESATSSTDQVTYTDAEHDAAEQLLSLFTEGDLPQFTAEDEQQEKAQMTEEEKQAALADMFGEMCMISHQDKRMKRPEPGTIKSLLRDLRLEIDNIPDAEKPALLKAMRHASPHEFYEKRLFLFLQCEKKDPRKAAERFVAYWEFRRTWFGEDKFCLPMTLDGAFRDDSAALEAGRALLLPGLDVSGRSIMYYPKIVHPNETGSALRGIWYVYEAAIEHSNAAGGIVVIFTAKSDDFWQIDMQLAKATTALQTSILPVTICAAHQVDLPLLIRRVFMPIWLAFADKDVRSRSIVHDGPREKLVEKFSAYGITKDVVPEEFGGKCKLDHSAWLAERRALGK